MMNWASTINPLDRSRPDCIGAKARALRKVLSSGIARIPESLCISKLAFDALKSVYSAKSNGVNLGTVDLPLGFAEAILSSVRETFGNRPLVVRSSASSEDSPIMSWAGQYSSFLNLRTDADILTAVKLCYSSLSSEIANLYAQIKAVNLEHEWMAVLLQELVDVTHSGVMFTADPIEGPEYILVEFVCGLGDGLVSGKAQPAQLRIARSELSGLPHNSIEGVGRLGARLETLFGHPVDVEWGWGQHQQNLTVFQVRPIATEQLIPRPAGEDGAIRGKVIGTANTASKRIASGRLRIIREPSFLPHVTSEDIVYYVGEPDSRLFQALFKSQGLITSGGVLSHIAIVARELGRVCLVEPISFDPAPYEGLRIAVDGPHGLIRVPAELHAVDLKNRSW